MNCELPPPGWSCTRDKGHDGPCAAIPVLELETEMVCKWHQVTPAPQLPPYHGQASCACLCDVCKAGQHERCVRGRCTYGDPPATPAQPQGERCLARTREGLECAYKPHDSRNHCWFDLDSPAPEGMPLEPVDLDALRTQTQGELELTIPTYQELVIALKDGVAYISGYKGGPCVPDAEKLQRIIDRASLPTRIEGYCPKCNLTIRNTTAGVSECPACHGEMRPTQTQGELRIPDDVAEFLALIEEDDGGRWHGPATGLLDKYNIEREDGRLCIRRLEGSR